MMHDARALLTSVVTGRLDDRIRDRIVAETGGNPLALLELPRGLATAELGGRIRVAGRGAPLGPDRRELRKATGALCPPTARQLLLVAAAEPVGELMLIWRAAQELGVGPDAVAPATAAGLVEFGAHVRFRHPLVRSAVYRGRVTGGPANGRTARSRT